MASKIGGGNPPPASFEKLSRDLQQAAGKLKPSTKNTKKKDPVSKAAASSYEAQAATAKLVEGLSELASEAGQLSATGSLVSAGVSGWVSDDMPEGAGPSSKNVSLGLATAHDLFTGPMAGAPTATVRGLRADPYAVEFSERAFGKASRGLNDSAGRMNAQWRSYAESVSHLDGPEAATNVAGLSDNLAKAAALTLSPQATKIAEFGARLSGVASRAAGKDPEAAYEIAMMAAVLAATTANVLANPDQSQVKDVVANQIAAYKTGLSQLVATHPGLGDFARPLLAK